jgi:chromosome segregation ATPase
MGTNSPHFFTEQDVKNFNAPLAKLAKKLHANDKPVRRPSNQIRAELAHWIGSQSLGLEGRVPELKRKLAEVKEHRDDLIAAIKRSEDSLASLRKAGVSERDSRIQRLIGYSFTIRWSDQGGWKNGIIQNLKEEMQRTEKDIDRISVALANTEREAARIVPALEKELHEALELETL